MTIKENLDATVMYIKVNYFYLLKDSMYTNKDILGKKQQQCGQKDSQFLRVYVKNIQWCVGYVDYCLAILSYFLTEWLGTRLHAGGRHCRVWWQWAHKNNISQNTLAKWTHCTHLNQYSDVVYNRSNIF